MRILPAIRNALLLTTFAVAIGAEELPLLRLLNWSTYIDQDAASTPDQPLAERSPTLRAFCAQHRCRIVYEEFDSEDAIEGRVLHEPDSVDLICCSADLMGPLVQARLLVAIDRGRTPQAAGIAARHYAHCDPSMQPYVQPYLAGTTGILYRTDLVPTPVRSWKQYFHPEPGQGKIIVYDETSILWGSALLAVGLPPAGITDPEQVRTAAREIAALLRSEQVHSVTADPEAINAALLAGEAAMSVQWSGDARTAMDAEGGKNLAYVIPDEGAEGWADYWGLMRTSRQVDLGYAFLDYIGSPAVQARLARELGYACANEEARPLIAAADPAWAADPVIFPEPAVQARLFPFATPHPDALALWTRLRDE
jgi:spermidine/putrescine-binding protein